jgi:hypothetical protein
LHDGPAGNLPARSAQLLDRAQVYPSHQEPEANSARPEVTSAPCPRGSH